MELLLKLAVWPTDLKWMYGSDQMLSKLYLPIQRPNEEIKSLVNGIIVVSTFSVLGLAKFATQKIMK